MVVSFSPPGDVERLIVIVFTSFALAYSGYYLLSHSSRIGKYFITISGPEEGSVRYVVLQRFVMFLGAGVAPALLIRLLVDTPLSEFGLRVVGSPRTALVAAGMTLASAAVSIAAAKSPHKLAVYPQIRRSVWGVRTIAINTATWALYLIAYEAMFRGFMLYALLPFGVWTSIAVNTSLYVAVHVPKGASEAAGALVYGPLLCLLTLWSGTIWIAFFAHVGLALGNSYSSLAANPAMSIAGFPRRGVRFRAGSRDDSPDSRTGGAL